MKNILFLLTFSLLLQAFSCGSYVTKTELVEMINEDMGLDNQITMVKEVTTRRGYIIVKQNGTYYALNAAKINKRYYENKYGPWYEQFPHGMYTHHSMGPFFNNHRFKVTKLDDTTYRGPLGWRYEKSEASPKDLEKMGFLIEVLEQEKIENALVEKYALSNVRAKELAPLIRIWKNKRTLTPREKNIFAHEMLGISPSETEKMYLEKDEKLLGKAAKANGITPEHFKELMHYFLGN